MNRVTCGSIVAPGHLCRRVHHIECTPAKKASHMAASNSQHHRLISCLINQEHAPSCFIQYFLHIVFSTSYVCADKILGSALRHFLSRGYTQRVTANTTCQHTACMRDERVVYRSCPICFAAVVLPVPGLPRNNKCPMLGLRACFEL